MLCSVLIEKKNCHIITANGNRTTRKREIMLSDEHSCLFVLLRLYNTLRIMIEHILFTIMSTTEHVVAHIYTFIGHTLKS